MKISHYFRQAEPAISCSICAVRVPFHVGFHFCMGAYKRNAVVVIKMGAYIHGVLIYYGCLLSFFYGINFGVCKYFLYVLCSVLY